MLERLFSTLIISSVVGSCIFVLLLIIKPLTKKVFSFKWHYYMYLLVLIIMLIPVKINFTPPADNKILNRISTIKYIPYEKTEILLGDTVNQNVRDISIAAVWGTVSLMLFAFKIINYNIFLYKLKRKSEKISCPQIAKFTSRSVRVRQSGCISSPFITGVFAPLLFLPKADISDGELNSVLSHEITHLTRNDILVKWIVIFAKCVHWFNPAVYFLSRQINMWCEISCDFDVTKSMSDIEKEKYIITILKLIEKNPKRYIYTSAMACSKKQLGKRFYFIKNAKKKKIYVSAFAAILSFLVVLGAIFSSGILSGIVNYEKDASDVVQKPKKEQAETVKTVLADTSEIDISKTEEALSDKVILQQAEKTETEKVQTDNQLVIEKEDIVENDDTVSEKILETAPNEEEALNEDIINIEQPEEYFAGDVLIEDFSNEMDTGDVIGELNSNPVLWKSPLDVVDLSTSHTWFDYSFDDEFSYTVTVVPDEKGMISLFFDTDFSSATADVYIHHEDRPKMGWGYKFPTNSKIIYKFCGFEKDEKYKITISSYFPGKYNITGKALII